MRKPPLCKPALSDAHSTSGSKPGEWVVSADELRVRNSRLPKGKKANAAVARVLSAFALHDLSPVAPSRILPADAGHSLTGATLHVPLRVEGDVAVGVDASLMQGFCNTLRHEAMRPEIEQHSAAEWKPVITDFTGPAAVGCSGKWYTGAWSRLRDAKGVHVFRVLGDDIEAKREGGEERFLK